MRPAVDALVAAWGSGFKVLGQRKKEWMQPSPLLLVGATTQPTPQAMSCPLSVRIDDHAPPDSPPPEATTREGGARLSIVTSEAALALRPSLDAWSSNRLDAGEFWLAVHG